MCSSKVGYGLGQVFMFNSLIHYYFDLSFPKRKSRINRGDAGNIRLDPDLVEMRSNLLQKYIDTKHLHSLHPLRREYDTLKKKFRNQIKSSKVSIALAKMNGSTTVTKSVGDIDNKFVPGKKTHGFSEVTVRNDMGNLLEDLKSMSDQFNVFFSGIAEKLCKKMGFSQNFQLATIL